MDINGAYPSNYIKAPDLQGREVNLTITRVVMEDIGSGEDKDHKPIVYFQGTEKGLALNRTNANNIALMYGAETNNWIGQTITLFPTQVDFKGRSVEAIRVKIAPVMPAAAPAPLGDQGGQVVAPQNALPSTPPTMSQELNDEIPF